MKILSFDVEDWFHVLDNPETAGPIAWSKMESRIEAGVDRILTLLNDTNQPATFFCLGWIVEKYPNIIKRISKAGHHLATHSHTHQLAYTQSKYEFEEDLRRSIDTLQQVSGIKINTYRAPGFSITSRNLWAFEILHKLGIENDCSIFPANRAHGGIPQYSVAVPSMIEYGNFTLKSLPINTTKFFGKDIVYSGGGYFRLFPLWYLKRRFKKDTYIMTYFHPRDFDPEQPMVPGLGLSRKFKSYVGVGRAYNKLEALLMVHDFVNVDMAIKDVNWESVVKVTVR
jgi:polysaccharide deacetylase family protein (PEP-CTERM system associated)